MTSLDIAEAAERGDVLAKRAFEHTGEMLGFKLADLVAHTNPEAIFLFGGLTLAKGLIMEPTLKAFHENLLSIYRGKVKLLALRSQQQKFRCAREPARWPGISLEEKMTSDARIP